MRKFHAYTLNSWPTRQGGELIFTCTEEAIYYAHLLYDTQPAYDRLKNWRTLVLKGIKVLKAKHTVDYDRIFDLAFRSQLFRECMEEIQRLNTEEP